MKNQILNRAFRSLLIAALGVSGPALAQTDGQSSVQSNSQSLGKLPQVPPSLGDFASKGARLTLSKPILTSELVQDIKGKKYITSDQPAGAFALGFGYVYLPIRKIGWTSDFSAVSFSYNQSMDVQYTLRLAGNVAAALNENLYFKSGVNLSQTLGSRVVNGIATQTRPGLGFQSGLGYQLTPSAGVEASYVWMTQPHNAGGELLAQGAEIGISGNF